MDTYKNLINNTYSLDNSHLGQLRLIFSLALLGMTIGLTNGCYLGAKTMTPVQIVTKSRHDLETHTGTDYSQERIVADPKRLREIHRLKE